ncbi:MAG: WXG100 family type VII secretion target [Lacisediminihabitans sp.]
MTDAIMIDFERMEQLSSIIAKANLSITASLQELDATVSTLGGEWTGAASESYRAAHRQWAESLGKMNHILGQVSSTVSGVTQRHRDTESKVRSLWS